MLKISRENYSVKLSDPIVYVDNESRARSGHMTHAMAEYKKGAFIDCYTSGRNNVTRHANIFAVM